MASIGRAGILVRRVRAADLPREPLHRLRHRRDAVAIERVRPLPRLEKDVRILRGAAQDRVVRGESAGAVVEHELRVDHRPELLVVEQGHVRDLVRGAEAVEEVEERHARLERGRLCDEREVVSFLHARRAEHRPPRRARGHDVAVVAEDRQRMRGDRSRGDVEHRRRQLARDLVHVRDHQQQPLRRGEGRGQGAGLQRAVYGTGGTGFALHYDDRGDGAPEIRPLLGRPGVGPFAHRRRGRDRIDRDHFIQGVGDTGSGFVSIEQGLHEGNVRSAQPSADDGRQFAV
jgi:hypothetical protein